ncbi:MAG TPA: Asp-tRNA(Asn)/Glu-tRNA(Gln) amidotransferase subunit GatC [Pseudomonadales bacterium]|nr:Asp-tRNA(Asn)/Glu-tRNA(Gln) amidotransferase subunit GatC [Pseudomonadales bacterium]
MKMKPEEIQRIAQLARLRIDVDHHAEVGLRLSAILDLVQQMHQVDTQNIEPLAHPLNVTQRLRGDEVTETDQRERFQQLAPLTEDGLYLVPKVIE